MQEKRYTIGYLDENSYDEYHSFITAGLFDAARKHDMNVIRFGHFFSHITSKDDAHAAKVLDFISQFRLDGLIFLGWARAVAFEMEKFIGKFSHLPLISLGMGVPGIHSLYFPGDRYVQEVLLHLAEVHGFTRIAFIEPFWPDNRTDVYMDFMKSRGIYDPLLFVGSDELLNLDVPDRGRKAVSILLDGRGIKPEAIVSLYNDETKGIYSELNGRGFSIPDDIAVTSYEDGELGRFSAPPVTTVYFPWRELGLYAGDRMYDLLTGKDVPLSERVPGKVIIRQSCGCIGDSVRFSETGKIEASDIPFEKLVLPEYESTLRETACSLERGMAYRSVNAGVLLETLGNDFNNRNDMAFHSTFLPELELQLRGAGSRMADLRGIAADLRRNLIPFFIPYIKTDPDTYIWAENLLQQAQVLLQDKINSEWDREEIRSRSVYLMLKEISQILITNFTVKNLMDSLEINLPRLGIKGCRIHTFAQTDVDEYLFDESTPVFEYPGYKRADEEESSQESHGSDPAVKLFTGDGPQLVIAQLLHVADQFYGFALFEPDLLDIRIYQILGINISTALSGAILFEKLDLSYKRLVEQAHRKGMADISTGILHNIGNVLNSINVSAHAIKDLAGSSLPEDFTMAMKLLESKIDDIENFICMDPKGEKLMQYLIKLGDSFLRLQVSLRNNISRLSEKIDMIDDIVTAQQNYTGVKSTMEELDVVPVIEDALKMNIASLEKYGVRVVKDYKRPILAMAQKTKLFHVLANLVKNAMEAMLERPEDSRMMTLSVRSSGDTCTISVRDTGQGIPEDMLESIFAYGYTTKKGGHGFGLHSCANYMTEMEGRIWAESGGSGKGSVFMLQLRQDRAY